MIPLRRINSDDVMTQKKDSEVSGGFVLFLAMPVACGSSQTKY